MPDYSRIRRQQLLREAEGYLDLCTSLSELWPLSQTSRERMAARALDVLGRLDPSTGQRAHALFLTGMAYRTMERYADAIEPLKKATELDGDNIHIWLTLGWCYKRTSQLDLAIQALEDAMSVDSSEAIIHYNLACYWSLAGNAKRAVMFLSQAFELDSNYRDLVGREHDFDAIRKHPHFLALTTVIV